MTVFKNNSHKNYKDLDLMTAFNIIKPNVRVDQSQEFFNRTNPSSSTAKNFLIAQIQLSSTTVAKLMRNSSSRKSGTLLFIFETVFSC